MKARWKIPITLTVLLILFIGLSLVTMHIQPQNEVEAYKKLLREKGEKLEISEVLPPPVPAESNGVSLVQAAFSLLIPGSAEIYSNLPPMLRMVAPGKAIVGWAQPDLRGSDFTNSWENALAATETNRPGFELLQQAANFPALDFQLNYHTGPELLLPHLSPLKRCAQKLTAAAMCDLHQGDAAAATTNLCVLLSLVQADRAEPLIISQLVRIAMAAIAASANWELLQATNLTDAELAALQKNWERQEFIAGMKGAFEMERASNDATIQKMRASSAEFNRLTGYGSGGSSSGGWSSASSWYENLENFTKDSLENSKRRGAAYMWRASWSYSEQLHVWQSGQIALEGIHIIQTNQVFQPTMKDTMDRLDKLQASFSGSGWLANFNKWLSDGSLEIFSSGGYEGNCIRKVLAAETSRRVVITAIALKRFQLKHGNFPEKLTELSPELLAATPLDPVDGNPLRYRRNADGTFLLYSIGDNGVDDGGDPTPVPTITSSWNWQRARDWVWPQPATEAEVKSFSEHPPK